MKIADFDSLLQLAATLNIALVAVEYANNYVQTLVNRVFKFKDHVESEFSSCEKILTDKVTLDLIEPVDLSGNSTMTQIEKLKRQREVIEKRIESHKKQFISEIECKCKSKSLSSLALWFALFSTCSLFLSGIESSFEQFSKHMWMVLVIASVLFLIISLIWGEKEKPLKYFDLSRLKHCIWCFVIVILLTAIIAVTDYQYHFLCILDPIWGMVLTIGAILPFANFLLFFVFVRKKIKSIRSKVDGVVSEISNECNTHKKEVELLSDVAKLNANLLAEDKS